MLNEQGSLGTAILGVFDLKSVTDVLGNQLAQPWATGLFVAHSTETCDSHCDKPFVEPVALILRPERNSSSDIYSETDMYALTEADTEAQLPQQKQYCNELDESCQIAAESRPAKAAPPSPTQGDSFEMPKSILRAHSSVSSKSHKHSTSSKKSASYSSASDMSLRPAHISEGERPKSDGARHKAPSVIMQV